MQAPPKTHQEWLQQYYGSLKGCRITNVEIIKEDDEFMGEILWPVIHAIDATGMELRIEVSQDEEGNGAGFLFGLPTPKPIESA